MTNFSQKRRLLKILRYIVLFILTVLGTASIVKAQFPESTDDIDWLIEALELQKGSVVADIGAGDGDQTLAIARFVGPEGHIYSTEIGSELKELRDAIKNTDVKNVTVIEAHPKKTNLPKHCCDALFLRRVYHHLDNPEAMNASMWQSLKPGGRIAVIDFEPRGMEANPEERDTDGQHGVTADTVVEELKKAGFILVSSNNPAGRNFYVVMKKPIDS